MTQAGRDIGAVHLLQVSLNLARRHATGVQRDDFVIEPSPAGLVLGDDLGLETAVAVSGYLDRQGTEVTFSSNLQKIFKPQIFLAIRESQGMLHRAGFRKILNL